MIINIDGNLIKDENDFHKQIARQLNIDQFYGHNLDALWDLLSSGVGRPLCLRWNNSAESELRLGENFKKIISIFERVQLQDEKFEWSKRFTYSLG